MDRERFDGIARAFGERRGWRAAPEAALGLGTALAAGRRVGAVVARAPGEPCHRDDRCVWDFGREHVCADNGFGDDNATHRCTCVGNSRTRNEECRRDASCIGGVCSYGELLAGAGKGCWSDRDCNPAVSGLFGHFNDWDNSARVCRGYDGQCRGSLRCRGGRCT